MTYNTDLFDGMVADVITLTARPDLAAETALALRTATNNAHFCDAFPRDLHSKGVQLPILSYSGQLDIPTLFPALRGLSKVRQLDMNMSLLQVGAENELEIIELGDIYDEYGAFRSNVAYIGGDKVNFRSNVLCAAVSVEWFQAPSTKREAYNSWIAQLYPDVILYWAASIVLSTNGNEEKAAKFMQLTTQLHIPFLKSNFLLGELR